MKHPCRLAVLASLLPLAATVGCSNALETSGSPVGASGAATASIAPITPDAALTAKLPAKVQSAKKIVIGTNATYKPNEYTEGDKIVGMDIDLYDAVFEKMGVDVQWQQSPFDLIITGVQASKYDAGVSSFTITAEREKSVNMVSYLNAGTLWAVKAGNPLGIDRTKPCGHTIAVETGTMQYDELAALQKTTCKADPIDIKSFQEQADATTAVISGRVDAMSADSPITDYAIQTADGAMEALGESYDSAPYGIVLPKADTELAEGVKQALEALKEGGQYDAILAKWGQTDGAIDSFEVNPV